MEQKTVDVIIPTYKPKEEFIKLVEKLEHQTYPIRKIIIMNTEERYFSGLLHGQQLELEHNVSVTHISKMEFDHGHTRREGVKKSEADIFIFMTDDAMPKNSRLIEALVAPILEDKADFSYARQLPRENAGAVEGFTRLFNYPKESRIKSIGDLNTLGIKTYFFSNVCAAYRRDIYDELGGFVDYTLFNEDMLFAAKAIQAGYRIAYVAEAEVIHSHHYTNRQQFHRNFDIGVSQAEHPEVFDAVPSTKEGKKLVRKTLQYLRAKKKILKIPGFLVTCCYKYAGYKLGKNYERLPEKWVLKLTTNREYWLKKNIRNATSSINPYSGYGISPEERENRIGKKK
ncbi:MAG: glycosyltransferase [Lachnospiraceae bacterium]|nr:glycosyltransferase [Lachnospiraceae bacterium]